ncbi:outer membrane beta-barrel protein [Hymenobacter metallicola]|uniref:PorT family protein n=1 Tax=Hymenobacter metallicola TaxID=2563114 RepID=A0A4Z0QAV7_9BACT|nr:outer membrane beta-barrel protein [Hymenobacter metallicola]TGE27208.1 PorT family protein [Hymenobacter metallicola]
MVPTANNYTPTPEPTGDLEQLFRQKLGEAEVAPRMHLWEQIDHELLVQQNETFRRRLVWHRWVAAACILLFLGAGGWFTLRPTGSAPVSADLATRTLPATHQAATGASSGAGQTAGSRLASGAPVPDQPGGNSDLAATGSADANPMLATVGAEYPVDVLARAESAAQARALGRQGEANPELAASRFRVALPAEPALAEPIGTFFDRVVGTGRTASSTSTAGTTTSAAWYAALNSRAASNSSSVGLPGVLRSAQPDTAKASLPTTLPAAFAQVVPAHEENKPEMRATRPKRWRLMGSYGAGAYNPNMSFASAQGVAASAPNGVATSPNSYLRANATYEQAAAEYRQNLRPGFAQRVALTISYAATKHWTMNAGVQAAEQQATSQTSFNFLDGKLPAQEYALTADKYNALPPPRPTQLRTTQYRYRTAGIPVSVRYGSAKNGWSLYAKVGAAVNVLFNSRSELVGVPEATTTYSLGSVGSPYRKVQSSVNGGAGLRYKPAAAQWSVALGPTAEAGLTTLNANTSQSSAQARPYAVGMEASVEFGGKAASVIH